MKLLFFLAEEQILAPLWPSQRFARANALSCHRWGFSCTITWSGRECGLPF